MAEAAAKKAKSLPATSAEDGQPKAVVLVTGGTGLVGKGIEAALGKDQRDHEQWVFLSSKDGDLRFRCCCGFALRCDSDVQ